MATKKSTKTGGKDPQGAKARKRKDNRAAAEAAGSKLSALDAAARVLRETKRAMSCPELIETMAAKGYWASPAGKTPEATLYTAVTKLPKRC
jgi:hypothetical protein